MHRRKWIKTIKVRQQNRSREEKVEEQENFRTKMEWKEKQTGR